MENNVSTKDLAQIFGVTPRRVQQLATKGILHRESNGKFNLPDSLKSFYEWKITHTNYNPDRDKWHETYNLEHARLERVKRQMVELELGVKNGDLLVADDVEQTIVPMLLTCRNRLLAIPSKCAPRLAACKDIVHAEKILQREILEALDILKPWPHHEPVHPGEYYENPDQVS